MATLDIATACLMSCSQRLHHRISWTKAKQKPISGDRSGISLMKDPTRQKALKKLAPFMAWGSDGMASNRANESTSKAGDSTDIKADMLYSDRVHSWLLQASVATKSSTMEKPTTGALRKTVPGQRGTQQGGSNIASN